MPPRHQDSANTHGSLTKKAQTDEWRSLSCEVSNSTEGQRSGELPCKNEQRLNDFFENAAVGLHWVGPDTQD